jgi:hypothetical protein
MNDNIESKLNELLKMKDDLDELKSRRKQQETIDDFEKKQKQLKIYYYVWLALGVIIFLGGMSGLEHNSEKYRLNALVIAMVGLNLVIMIKIWYFIYHTRLSLLQELKQLRLELANHTPEKERGREQQSI